MVGAPSDDTLGALAGAVYVFRYDEPQQAWIETQKLLAADGEAEDGFGWSIALTPTHALIGAPLVDTSVPDAGAAYLFTLDATQQLWTQQQKLISPQPTQDDICGISVSITEQLIALGCLQQVAPTGSGPGHAEVFRKVGSTVSWEYDSALADPLAQSDAFFGNSVAALEEAVLVGSFSDDSLATNAGAVHYFESAVHFRRDDANNDGLVDLADPIYVLLYLFLGLDPPCLESLDTNDDGDVDIADPVAGLSYLFSQGPPPPPPTLSCGLDPTQDVLTCGGFSTCP